MINKDLGKLTGEEVLCLVRELDSVIGFADKVMEYSSQGLSISKAYGNVEDLFYDVFGRYKYSSYHSFHRAYMRVKKSGKS